jgi:calnexin
MMMCLQVHVILNMLNPVTQQVTEHHLMSAPAPKADKLSHVYTLVLYQNQM